MLKKNNICTLFALGYAAVILQGLMYLREVLGDLRGLG